MKYAVVIGSGAMYIPVFIKIISEINKFMRGRYADTERAQRRHKSAFIFFSR
jgi:hypothetical protein